ncbi:MAG: hypothetical protein FWB71_03315 [Defluviitaleaceae bacterium]|nr:hypothetical protein [Defluviitaleaceae bacterium]
MNYTDHTPLAQASADTHFKLYERWRYVLFAISLAITGITTFLAIGVIPAAIGVLIATIEISVQVNQAKKTNIFLFDNAIVGRGLRWHLAREFVVPYSQIKSVKLRDWGIILRTTEGRYKILTGKKEHLIEILIYKKMEELV